MNDDEFICEFWNYIIGVADYSIVLSNKSSLLSNPKPTFRSNGSPYPVKDILPLEHEANVLYRSIGIRLLSDEDLYFRRKES